MVQDILKGLVVAEGGSNDPAQSKASIQLSSILTLATAKSCVSFKPGGMHI